MNRKPIIIWKVFDTTEGETYYYGTEKQAREDYANINGGTLAKVLLRDFKDVKDLALACLRQAGYAAIHEVLEDKLEE